MIGGPTAPSPIHFTVGTDRMPLIISLVTFESFAMLT